MSVASMVAIAALCITALVGIILFWKIRKTLTDMDGAGPVTKQDKREEGRHLFF